MLHYLRYSVVEMRWSQRPISTVVSFVLASQLLILQRVGRRTILMASASSWAISGSTSRSMSISISISASILTWRYREWTLKASAKETS